MHQEYGVGRGTLREGLRYLEMQGVLRIKSGPSGGPVVNGVDSRPLARNLALLLALDRTPFRSILEVRQMVEPPLAAKGALNDDPENLAQLEESLRSFEAAAEAKDAKQAVLENRVFHDLVAERAGNAVFAHFVIALNWIIDGTALGVRFPEASLKATASAHRRIYDAIAAGDEQEAHDAMATHLDEFNRYVERRFSDILDVPIRWEDANY